MKVLDLSFPSPAENLACDEALLDLCEAGEIDETLRLWESPVPFVVVGYANKTADEVLVHACRRDAVPVLRRISGGGSVVQGPGCLNFSLILRIPIAGPLTGITSTNDWITARHAEALRLMLGAGVRARGLSDLTLGALKFSGNAQRRRRRSLLFHGTFLLDFDLMRVERALAIPARQPEYRAGRAHRDFLVNAGLKGGEVKRLLREMWAADVPFADVPFDRIRRLVHERYLSPEWTFRW